MQKIVLATTNQGKICELNSLFANIKNIEIISQDKFNVPDVEETGLTFIENAILKARHTSKITRLPSIADDSGLVVDALNGMPGIYSARYSGGDYQDNIEKLLYELKDVPFEKRTAHYYCSIVFMRHENDPSPIICVGKWDGFILNELKGDKGFAYDPLFYVPSLNCTIAELEIEEKNKFSHRGQAINQLIQELKKEY